MCRIPSHCPPSLFNRTLPRTSDRFLAWPCKPRTAGSGRLLPDRFRAVRPHSQPFKAVEPRPESGRPLILPCSRFRRINAEALASLRGVSVVTGTPLIWSKYSAEAAQPAARHLLTGGSCAGYTAYPEGGCGARIYAPHVFSDRTLATDCCQDSAAALSAPPAQQSSGDAEPDDHRQPRSRFGHRRAATAARIGDGQSPAAEEAGEVVGSGPEDRHVDGAVEHLVAAELREPCRGPEDLELRGQAFAERDCRRRLGLAVDDSRPCGVVVWTQGSVSERKSAPRSGIFPTASSRSRVERA